MIDDEAMSQGDVESPECVYAQYIAGISFPKTSISRELDMKVIVNDIPAVEEFFLFKIVFAVFISL